MVSAIVVADDASPCTYDGLLRDLKSDGAMEVVRFPNNAGIARSLNYGLNTARRLQARWLLTLDQDTQASGGYLVALKSDIEHSALTNLRVGVIAPTLLTTQGVPIRYRTEKHDGWDVTEEVFQSGAAWSVGALDAVGGFNEALGIDAVDSEACLSLREKGYRIVVSRSATVTHGWGDSKSLTVLGRPVFMTGHSPERRRTMVRNRILLFPRELRQSPGQAYRSMRRLSVNTALAVTLENQRWAKARASIGGLISGLSGRHRH